MSTTYSTVELFQRNVVEDQRPEKYNSSGSSQELDYSKGHEIRKIGLREKSDLETMHNQ